VTHPVCGGPVPIRKLHVPQSSNLCRLSGADFTPEGYLRRLFMQPEDDTALILSSFDCMFDCIASVVDCFALPAVDVYLRLHFNCESRMDRFNLQFNV
jgi:hypothetical protein